MTDDYENPEARERDLKNRVQRKKNFMKKEWRQVVRTGNFTLKYKGEKHYKLCVANMIQGGSIVIYAGKWRWDYHGRKISRF